MTKLKILYILTNPGIGGAQKYVTDLSNNLDKGQFKAKILYGKTDLKWLSNKYLPWTFFLNDWLAVFELVKVLRKEQPNIIHLNSSKAGVIGSLAAFIYNVKCQMSNVKCKSPKVIFTAHGWVFNPSNTPELLRRWLYILLHKIAATFQDKIICVSEYDYELALQYYIAPEKKLVTIHNGIDPNMKFLDEKTSRREILKKLNPKPLTLNPNYPRVGSIGRLVKEKNYETFIEAAALIPNAYFFIIGSGLEREALNKQLTTNNLQQRFFIVSPTGNDAQYLKAFDIFAMSSIKEGLPYVLLEAMLAEVPAVVTKAGGIPEMIKNHENGLMVAQRNPKALAKAIQGLLKNKSVASELKKKANDIVKNKFGLEKMVAKTTDVYRCLR